jgi:hypothetical protein
MVTDQELEYLKAFYRTAQQIASEEALAQLEEAARLMQEILGDQALPTVTAPYRQPERITAPTVDQYRPLKPYRLDRAVRSSLHHRKVITKR